MNRLIIALVFSLTFVFSGWAQQEKLSSYSFIVVPKKFDFQFGEDEYQLNSLLKFLFNKHGFHAYFDDELPDVKRCDGLRAEVMGDPGFVWCKVIISIIDCEGNVLYKSHEGKSKLKEYSKMYNDAMRKAFESIEVLFVQQKEVRVLKEYDDSIETKEENVAVNAVENNPLHLPTVKYGNFIKENKSFLMQKTNDGYSLYLETSQANDGLQYIGKIFIVEGVVFFEDQNKNRFLASFDTSGNFIVAVDDEKQKYLKSN
ncbi:MAG: hypothetical protein R2781_05485 [Flavobacteriaceae bacterium]